MAGRPPTKIDKNVLEAIMQYGATCLDCAGHFGCSTDTIVNFIKKNYKMNFSEFSDKMMYRVRIKLRQKMFDSAMAGNTAMMIWLSKQWLGMKDKQDIDANINSNINLVIDPQDAKL